MQKASSKAARAVLLALIISSLLPLAARADAPSSNFVAALDRQVPALLARYHVPGVVLSYIENGDVAWTKAYGLADTGSGEPMQADTILEHGSNGKVIATWGVMRLADMGRVNLDSPVNQYLKRWKISSTQYNPDGVTLRRLVSHTSGLSLHSFSDYRAGRSLPTLVEALQNANQMNGDLVLQSEPGTQFAYSGGGFALAQMVIEDVSGESFASFMEREVTGPLGMTSFGWEWTPERIARAAVGYDSRGYPVGYRQLATHAAGSEMSTVPDFARWLAAAVAGPNGEPAGRGVLEPETVAQMLEVQPHTNNTEGLGYGIDHSKGDQLVMHFGGNPGWTAHFVLDVERREGFVVAANSSNAQPLNLAIQSLWRTTVLGDASLGVPAPDPIAPTPGDQIALGIALVLVIPLILSLAWFAFQLYSGRRRFGSLRRAYLLFALPWIVLALFWWDWLYSPVALFIPPALPDAWVTPEVNAVLLLLLGWIAFSLLTPFFPKQKRLTAKK